MYSRATGRTIRCVLDALDEAEGLTSPKGNYYTEPYGKPGQESKTAQDEAIANNFWELCAKLTQEITGEDLK